MCTQSALSWHYREVDVFVLSIVGSGLGVRQALRTFVDSDKNKADEVYILP
jgi:hypothetical protein